MTPVKEKARAAGRGKLAVEYVAIDSIKPSPKNTRTHPPEQVTQIAASIKTNRWTKPIIVDEKSEILAGHGAHMAAQQLGETDVPIIRRAGLTAAQKRAYRIADNKIGENSGWDAKLLAAEFTDLAKMGFDVTQTGFNQTEIDFLLRPPAQNITEPPTPDIKGPAVSRMGDLWLLGDHRLIIGDSTKAATFKQLMNGQQAQCVFTDPPYGVSYGEGRPTARHPKRFKVIEGDDHRRGELVELLSAAFGQAMTATRDNAAWYIWHGLVTRSDFETAILACGLIEPPNGYIVWVKPPTMGWSDYKSAFEPCFYVHKQGITPPFYGDRTNTTTWEASAQPIDGAAIELGSGVILTSEAGEILVTTPPKGKAKTMRHQHVGVGEAATIKMAGADTNVWRVGRSREGEDQIHPTQKPVELARRALNNSTLEGQIVLDMFSGSGSTIMGAEQTRRVGYAVELDPLYADASIRRWQNMTGKAATHAEENKTFDAIAKSRQA